jgi:hypothetical protein
LTLNLRHAFKHTKLDTSVVTVDGNISAPKATDIIKGDSYILLTPDGNIKSLKAEIIWLAKEGTKFIKLWNSETRLFVAGVNEFTMSQQTDISDFFSKLKIYNCIIVSQGHYVIERDLSRPINVNNVDTDMKLGV